MTIRLRACLGAAVVASLAPAPLAAGRALPAEPRSRAPYALDLPLARGGFAWSSPLAQRNDLYAVKGTADGSRIWAVGAAGTVLSLRGTEAKLEASGTEMDLYDVWVTAADDVWAVGERGTRRRARRRSLGRSRADPGRARTRARRAPRDHVRVGADGKNVWVAAYVTV